MKRRSWPERWIINVALLIGFGIMGSVLADSLLYAVDQQMLKNASRPHGKEP